MERDLSIFPTAAATSRRAVSAVAGQPAKQPVTAAPRIPTAAELNRAANDFPQLYASSPQIDVEQACTDPVIEEVGGIFSKILCWAVMLGCVALIVSGAL